MSIVNESWFDTRERLRASLGRTTGVERGLQESVDFTRDLLRDKLQAVYGGRRRSIWVGDFGDDWVVYDVEGRDVNDEWTETKYKQGYSIDADNRITLADDRVAVRSKTEYVPEPEQARAFKLEANGKTLITGPATAFLEKAASPNPLFLNIMGRFVGAEKANRNGAFWATEDLVFGQPTVKHGPLNWLHEERHIVGAITEAALLTPETASDSTEIPYIAASAALWRWLWPTEAQVVEMAAQQGNLWYSMECISDTVICHGDAGCGAEVPYLAALHKTEEACEHIRERSSERRFKEPVFLGGAVIVPPVRPGWDSAHATVLSEAAAFSERAFEQAGRPDVESNQWDRLMAQVLEFARA